MRNKRNRCGRPEDPPVITKFCLHVCYLYGSKNDSTFQSKINQQLITSKRQCLVIYRISDAHDWIQKFSFQALLYSDRGLIYKCK